MKKQLLLTTLLSATVASSAAFAAKPNTYVIINGVYSNIATDIGDASTVSDSATDWSIDAATKPAFSEGDVSDSGAGFRLGAGMTLSENWAIEISYALLGKGTDTLKDQTNGDIEITTRARSASLDVLRNFNITDQIHLYGKAGIEAWTVDFRAKQTGKDADHDNDSGYMPTIGLGAKYDLNDAVSLQAELSYHLYQAEFSQYETKANPVTPVPEGGLNVLGRYNKIGADVEIVSFSLGAAYRF